MIILVLYIDSTMKSMDSPATLGPYIDPIGVDYLTSQNMMF